MAPARLPALDALYPLRRSFNQQEQELLAFRRASRANGPLPSVKLTAKASILTCDHEALPVSDILYLKRHERCMHDSLKRPLCISLDQQRADIGHRCRISLFTDSLRGRPLRSGKAQKLENCKYLEPNPAHQDIHEGLHVGPYKGFGLKDHISSVLRCPGQGVGVRVRGSEGSDASEALWASRFRGLQPGDVGLAFI